MARTLIGTVVSDKADKTIVIAVHTSMRHPIYRKQYSITKKFIAHDEQNAAHIGDSVEITEGRPISARKRFTMTRILESAKITHKEDTAAPAAASEEVK